MSRINSKNLFAGRRRRPLDLLNSVATSASENPLLAKVASFMVSVNKQTDNSEYYIIKKD